MLNRSNAKTADNHLDNMIFMLQTNAYSDTQICDFQITDNTSDCTITRNDDGTMDLSIKVRQGPSEPWETTTQHKWRPTE